MMLFLHGLKYWLIGMSIILACIAAIVVVFFPIVWVIENSRYKFRRFDDFCDFAEECLAPVAMFVIFMGLMCALGYSVCHSETNSPAKVVQK